MLGVLVLGALVVGVVVYVAWPLVRPASAADRLDPLSEAQRRRLALREERDLALAALKELEVDLRITSVIRTMPSSLPSTAAAPPRRCEPSMTRFVPQSSGRLPPDGRRCCHGARGPDLMEQAALLTVVGLC